MKGIIAWLKSRLSSPESPEPAAATRTADSVVSPAPQESEDASMPDSYTDDLETTVPDLEILGPAAEKKEESTGFDPYDTAVLHKKDD